MLVDNNYFVINVIRKRCETKIDFFKILFYNLIKAGRMYEMYIFYF